MKIEKVEPNDRHYIVFEELLEPKKKSIIALTEDAKKQVENIDQRVYKIRCIPDKSDFDYKVGERLFISANPVITPIKVNNIIYLVLKEYDILGKIID